MILFGVYVRGIRCQLPFALLWIKCLKKKYYQRVEYSYAFAFWNTMLEAAEQAGLYLNDIEIQN